ncbi:uncharacterized protein LAESUDRAFT_750990 [Laetiporus sulphureus 93-53]|uniref:Uncharacterized protein n=1 Tax=Laetiporus sulphureus 93-53 TaxID=1314785 RepID=A0A165DGW8_9APHY|nr:uncharacterized protein LAESUDRAFT_750990 [Laetiporus sulphureus 93-53]KZT04853.1 hypothetical protein LAESUDRAFT_750990 [Laetiporus sulphureus 93-53]
MEPQFSFHQPCTTFKDPSQSLSSNLYPVQPTPDNIHAEKAADKHELKREKTALRPSSITPDTRETEIKAEDSAPSVVKREFRMEETDDRQDDSKRVSLDQIEAPGLEGVTLQDILDMMLELPADVTALWLQNGTSDGTVGAQTSNASEAPLEADERQIKEEAVMP